MKDLILKLRFYFKLHAIFKIDDLDGVKVTSAESFFDLIKLYGDFVFSNGLFRVVLTVRAEK